jgi:hypothetical protein
MNLWRTEANRRWQLIYNLIIIVYSNSLPKKIQLTF